MPINKIYFVAGASGSGKTAIIPHLKQLLPNTISVYDFDDIGVPENADTQWRQQATEQWLQKIIDEKKDVCLLGQMVLGEILACPSAKKLGTVNFYLLDVSDSERIKRLKKRNTYGADQNMLNWASWLRMHHQEAQWEQHVITNNSWSGLDFNQWNKLTNWNSLAHVTIIDTTHLSIDEVAATIIAIINPYHYQIKTNPNFDLSISTTEEQNLIDDMLSNYNLEQVPATQKNESMPLHYCVKDQGALIGGINAVMYKWNILYIDVLFVPAAYRKNKLGSYLLQKVESEAKQMGANLAHLDTFDFQAKKFYIKHGYEIFGVLEDCPEGHKRYFLKKAL